MIRLPDTLIFDKHEVDGEHDACQCDMCYKYVSVICFIKLYTQSDYVYLCESCIDKMKEAFKKEIK